MGKENSFHYLCIVLNSRYLLSRDNIYIAYTYHEAFFFKFLYPGLPTNDNELDIFFLESNLLISIPQLVLNG